MSSSLLYGAKAKLMIDGKVIGEFTSVDVVEHRELNAYPLEGCSLTMEDLSCEINVTMFYDPIFSKIAKYRGKASKRRYENIMKMAWRKWNKSWGTND